MSYLDLASSEKLVTLLIYLTLQNHFKRKEILLFFNFIIFSISYQKVKDSSQKLTFLFHKQMSSQGSDRSDKDLQHQEKEQMENPIEIESDQDESQNTPAHIHPENNQTYHRNSHSPNNYEQKNHYHDSQVSLSQQHYREDYLSQSNKEQQAQQQVQVVPSVFNMKELGDYLIKEETLEDLSHSSSTIRIKITKTEKKGNIMTGYYVYIIEGQDQKGSFNVARRFNQFYEMRVAMITRWPGCFIPSIPAKNMLTKKDGQLVERRKRYLNEFLQKMTRLQHLYYGEQFQALIRADQNDISTLFSKWAPLTTQAILNKYKMNFSELSGKQLNYETSQRINDFVFFIKRNQSQLEKDRQAMKKLAETSEKLNNLYGDLFSKVFPNYEKSCLSYYCNNEEQSMLYLNESQAKLNEHATLIQQGIKNNRSYWLLYDMIRHEERDGLAFLEAFQAKEKYEKKKHSIDVKISQHQKTISELSLGKKSLTTMTTKGTNEEIKYKLEVEVEQLKREKQSVLIMIDIVSALLAYIEIERYSFEKKHFYKAALGRISNQGIVSIQNMGEIWSSIEQVAQKRIKYHSP